jgi:glycosyltransferase involved in cell wall biosynthesis
MAMRLPVVTSQHQPYPEFVDPSFGMMVDERDADAVAAALAALLENPAQRAAMGERGRGTVQRSYTWSTIADQFIALIRA